MKPSLRFLKKDNTLIFGTHEKRTTKAPISHSSYTLVAENTWGNERTESRTI
jgi:hypothetical protein